MGVDKRAGPPGKGDSCCTYLASFPGSAAPEREYVYAGRAWYLFSRDHDVIETGPQFLEQKGSVSHIDQPTIRSTLGVYNIRPPIARYM